MNWQLNSLRFAQHFPDGYRFLDNAGAFMLAAIDKFDLMPGEIVPTGGQFSMPEKGLRGSVNTTTLEVIQEMPVDQKFFRDISSGIACLAQEHVGPLHLEVSSFEMKFMAPMQTEEAANKAILQWRNQDFAGMSKVLEMVPETTRLDATFNSGSQRLRLVVNAVAFEAIRIHRHNPTIMATKSQVRRAGRLTAGAERMPDYPPYAIFLEVTLSESTPPVASEDALFELLLQKAEFAKTIYSFK